MSEQWQRFQAFLQPASTSLTEGLHHARDNASICALSYYGLVALDGADAEGFLHGQLSSDVQSLARERCQLSTYNSPKGRVLATLLLLRTDDGFLAQLPAAIDELICRRLAMFVLRSNVRVQLASERYIRIGVCGPKAQAVIAASGLAVPREEYGLLRECAFPSASNAIKVDVLLRLPGHRYELLLSDAAAAISAWSTFVAQGATPAHDSAWRWATLQCGIPEIVAETQDQFVAQMLNYELVGGVSFSKGCYPGQEIVARTQYRGEIKRRTFLAHVSSDHEPAPAEAIFSSCAPAQAAGAVVNSAPAPDGGYDLLACLHCDFVTDGSLHLGTVAGPRVELHSLPYSLRARA